MATSGRSAAIDMDVSYGAPLVVCSHLPLAAGCTDRGVIATQCMLKTVGLETIGCSPTMIDVRIAGCDTWSADREASIAQVLNTLGRCFAPGANLAVAMRVTQHRVKCGPNRFLRCIHYFINVDHEVVLHSHEWPWRDRKECLGMFATDPEEVRRRRIRLDALSVDSIKGDLRDRPGRA